MDREPPHMIKAKIPNQPVKSPYQQEDRFKYAKTLNKYIKGISTNFTPSIDYQPPVHTPKIIKQKLQGFLKQSQSNLLVSFQSEQEMFFAFAIQSGNNTKIKLFYFQKQTGQHAFSFVLYCNLHIVCGKFSYILKSDINKEKETCLVLLLGSEQGIFKTIKFAQKKHIVQSLTIDKRPIVNIAIQNQVNQPICFALNEQFSIFVINYRKNLIIAHLRANLIDSDRCLKISMHIEDNFLLSFTETGHITIWKISQAVKDAIALSESQQKFKIEDKVFSISPLSNFHSASIKGLQYAGFLGDLIWMVTKDGKFKIIAINIQQGEDYISLLEYKIQRPQKISCIKMKSEEKNQYLLLCRSGEKQMQKICFNDQLQVTYVIWYQFQQMSNIEQFWISEQENFLLLRNKENFFITKLENFQLKEIEMEDIRRDNFY